ncbi:SH3 domain-containing kinase-binding protein 1 [Nelusetta ayraudi]|uniref:SH3 domain-containing kinase-binding protein 1 n=1 Tax=Nelusetta ayraudi TaxID=303726 RepID=UPI003F70B7DA
MEEKRREDQSGEVDSSTHEENSEGAAPAAEAKSEAAESFSSLLPKALSAVLHPGSSPPNPQPGRERSRRSSLNLQQLQAELRDLREQFDQMKSQHNKEIKLLMNELDEEKRIRLTLQMEIQRMKKHMSK